MFKDRDIICFLGDSITAADRWTAEVYQELRKKYKIKCYNCGVSGGRARRAAKYLHSRCLSFNPDYVTICFGINDIDRQCYADRENPENAAKIKSSLAEYEAAIESIINDVIASGAQPILCIPSPYDEVSDIETPNLKCQCGLEQVEEIIRKFAEKYNCPLVDFKKELLPLLGKEPIINADRVHPTFLGQHIMAQSFLRDMGEQETCDFDTPFEFEDWNRKRTDAYWKIQPLNFVEYCALFDRCYDANLTLAEKKEIAKKDLEYYEDKTEYIPAALAKYVEEMDNYDKYVGEIVKLTIF
ncbi:MAG: hypothetical protein IKW02_04095 [Clostridia bacterium]|nr:hypothetical protein [Clostridia bacterium]